MDLIRAAANARVTLGEALETVRLRLGEAALTYNFFGEHTFCELR